MMEENKDNNKWVEETKSGFVKNIVDGFGAFVKIFKEQGFGFVSLVLVLFLFFYFCILSPIDINKIVMNTLYQEEVMKQEQKQKSLEQRLEADKMINDLMTEIIDNYDVNRCILLEAHNGTSNIAQNGGVDFLFYSAVNEMINTNNKQGQDVYDINYESDLFQRQAIGNLIGIESYNRLRHSKFLYFSDLDSYHRSNYRFISKMRSIGSESVMIVPFVSNNIPQILLVISSREPELPAEKIYSLVERYRSQIEKLLMNIID